MGRGISFNALTPVTLHNLAQNQLGVEDHLRRLSTGRRVERTADDPAGQAVSERMRARLASQEVAERNIQDGVSMLQTAESSLSEVSTLLGRMRKLSVAALNGSVNDADLRSLQAEFNTLAQEIQRGVSASRFNAIPLFGDERPITVQSGPGVEDTIDVKLVNLSAMGVVLQVLDLRTNAKGAQETVDGYVELTAQVRTDLGAQEKKLGTALRATASDRGNLAASEGRIEDLDVAREIADQAAAKFYGDERDSLLGRARFQPQRILTLLEGKPLAGGSQGPLKET